MSKEIVINCCFGGFGLSHEAIMRYAELKGITLYTQKDYDFNHYTTVPYEQYQALHDECEKIHNFKKLNDTGWYFSERDIPRDDPLLIQVVQELKKKSWGMCAELKIVKIPEGVDWQIEEYDGVEHIAEVHRVWR